MEYYLQVETYNINMQTIGESQIVMLIERNQTQKTMNELILLKYDNDKF